jgi:hypothetical protein
MKLGGARALTWWGEADCETGMSERAKGRNGEWANGRL